MCAVLFFNTLRPREDFCSSEKLKKENTPLNLQFLEQQFLESLELRARLLQAMNSRDSHHRPDSRVPASLVPFLHLLHGQCTQLNPKINFRYDGFLNVAPIPSVHLLYTGVTHK